MILKIFVNVTPGSESVHEELESGKTFSGRVPMPKRDGQNNCLPTICFTFITFINNVNLKVTVHFGTLVSALGSSPDFLWSGEKDSSKKSHREKSRQTDRQKDRERKIDTHESLFLGF